MSSLQICLSLIFFYHCISIKGNDLHLESDFMSLVRTSGFVDKTMLIKQIFETGKRLLITAPRKFGKSTNLNMLDRFFSMKSLRNSMIINTFKSLYITEKNTDFFNDHFAKYPVVNVNFKVGIITTYAHAIYELKRVIRGAYLEHNYLVISKKISARNKRMCKYWCGVDSFPNMEKGDVMSSLVELVKMVTRHHAKRRTVLLIDEYDSFFNTAMLHVQRNTEFDRIFRLNTDILSTLINGSNDYVELAVVTGNSYISSAGLSDVNNLEKYYFLGDHPFGKYYGLTENEVAELYNKYDFRRKLTSEKSVKRYYNGYICKQGRHMYNTYSFLNFLDTGNTVVHWNTNNYFLRTIAMIKCRKVALIVDSLMKYKTITANLQYDIRMWQVKNLRKIYLHDNTHILYPNKDILLSHFLELGLLTYDTTLNNTYLVDEPDKVTIPNKEVYKIIFRNLKQYFTEKCNLTLFRSATYFEFKRELYKLYDSTPAHCKPTVEFFINDIKNK